MSSLHPIEGRISAPPFHGEESGRIGEPVGRHDRGKIAGNESGRISESVGRHHHHQGVLNGPSLRNGTAASGSLETPESAAIAELNGLISALGSLSAQAQGLPLAPPQPPNLSQGGYRPQPTDYAALADDAN